MRVNIVQGAEAHHQLLRRLRPYLRHAGDIVGGISHERLEIHELLRRHLPLPYHILRIVILGLRPSPLRFRDPDLNMLPGDLQKVPVAGNQRHLHAVLFRTFRQGSQDIIRLKPRLLHGADPHGGEHLLHHGHLLSQLLRHGLSRPLIFRVQLMPEGGRVHVKGHGKIARSLLLQDLEQDVQKAVNRVGMKPLGIAQVRHAVERPVQDAVPIDQYKLIAHFFQCSSNQNTTVVITRITASTASASK